MPERKDGSGVNPILFEFVRARGARSRLAKYLDIPLATLRGWVDGTTPAPTRRNRRIVRELARLIGCEVNALFPGFGRWHYGTASFSDRLRGHPLLSPLAQRAGGAKALGEVLGVGEQSIRLWLAGIQNPRASDLAGRYRNVVRKLAAMSGHSPALVRELLKRKPLDRKGSREKNRSPEWFVQFTHARGTDEMEFVERATAVERALGSLRRRERKVLELRFGFHGAPHTLEEISAVLGLTRERIRQLESRAMRSLRTTAKSELEVHWATDRHAGAEHDLDLPSPMTAADFESRLLQEKLADWRSRLAKMDGEIRRQKRAATEYGKKTAAKKRLRELRKLRKRLRDRRPEPKRGAR